VSGQSPKDRRFDIRACLKDMLGCVEAIGAYTDGLALPQFEADGKTQDAVLRRLEVLGEASGRLLRLGREAGKAFSALPLREVYDMRNALIHGYDGIDVSVVWKTVIRDIPALRQALENELSQSDQGGAP
jgi:uncharacterized protein with HEPN domain